MANLLTQDDIGEILEMADYTDIPEEIVDWAEVEVENIINKKYTAVTGQEKIFYLREDRQDYLQMPDLSNVSITKVEYYSESTLAWIEIESTNYYFEEETGLLFFFYDLYRETQYKVTYAYGGDTILDLEKKLHFLLVYEYLLKHKSESLPDSGSGNVKQEKIGDYSITYSVEEAKSKPDLVEKDIENTITILGGTQRGTDGSNDTELI